MWDICFRAAVAVLALTVLFATHVIPLRSRKGRQVRSLHILMAGCFLMSVILCVAPYYQLHAAENVGMDKIIVFSVQKAIRVFGADSLYDVVLDNISFAPAALADAYTVLTLTVQFVAPLLSFGFLLSFFKDLSAYLRYGASFFRDVYIFSELNEGALALAGDIRKNHRWAQIVFADVFNSDDEEAVQLEEEARGIGAICFKKDIASIRFGFHSCGSQMYFFAISEDESRNVEHALKLIGRYNMRRRSHLYIFSTGVEGELLLAGKASGRMKTRRIDSVRSLVARVLYEDGGRIFQNAAPRPDGDKQITAVIVGMGSHGTEMLRSLVWYCQMDTYHVQLHAFDRDPLAEEKIAARCPELLSQEYNGVEIPGEAAYCVKIHSGCDVQTKTFADAISDLKNATYVFVSLGSDEANVRTAVNLRMLFERIGAKPVIQAVISSREAGQALQKARNNAGQPYDIDFVGDLESGYSEKVILDSEVEKDAELRHKAYCNADPEKEEDFWRQEYCYRSSMATTIHAMARIQCAIPGADKPVSERTAQQIEALEALEHRRWNAYMRSEGFVYSGSADKSSRNDLAKMHHNLVPYAKLTDEDKRKDSRVSEKTEATGVGGK